MLDVLYSLAPYAPAVLFFASALDIFFATGLLLYGAAMLSSVAMMHASGMVSAPAIAMSAFLGTVTANSINFYCGRLFAESKLVQRYLQHSRMERPRRILHSNGLFFYILIGRFITFTRPLYALLAGSFTISFRRFILYESVIAAFWIVFWLAIILQGKEIILNIFT